MLSGITLLFVVFSRYLFYYDSTSLEQNVPMHSYLIHATAMKNLSISLKIRTMLMFTEVTLEIVKLFWGWLEKRWQSISNENVCSGYEIDGGDCS